MAADSVAAGRAWAWACSARAAAPATDAKTGAAARFAGGSAAVGGSAAQSVGAALMARSVGAHPSAIERRHSSCEADLCALDWRQVALSAVAAARFSRRHDRRAALVVHCAWPLRAAPRGRAGSAARAPWALPLPHPRLPAAATDLRCDSIAWLAWAAVSARARRREARRAGRAALRARLPLAAARLRPSQARLRPPLAAAWAVLRRESAARAWSYRRSALAPAPLQSPAAAQIAPGWQPRSALRRAALVFPARYRPLRVERSVAAAHRLPA